MPTLFMNEFSFAVRSTGNIWITCIKIQWFSTCLKSYKDSLCCQVRAFTLKISALADNFWALAIISELWEFFPLSLRSDITVSLLSHHVVCTHKFESNFSMLKIIVKILTACLVSRAPKRSQNRNDWKMQTNFEDFHLSTDDWMKVWNFAALSTYLLICQTKT